MEFRRENVEGVMVAFLETQGPAVRLAYGPRVEAMPSSRPGFVRVEAIKNALRDQYGKFWAKYGTQLQSDAPEVPPTTL